MRYSIKLLPWILAILLIHILNVQAQTIDQGYDQYKGHVAANSVTIFEAVFDSGNTVEVNVLCPESDCDLWIKDRGHKHVIHSSGLDGFERVVWKPAYRGKFFVIVENKKKPSGSDFALFVKSEKIFAPNAQNNILSHANRMF